MGTSSSNKGPRPGSPLIPPWAADPDGPPQPPPPEPPDEQPEQPDGSAPPAPTKPITSLNLSGFRRALGNVVARGRSATTGRDLGRTLGNYARATGGGSVAARRLASPARSGGRVFALFTTGTATGPGGRTVTLASLDGLSVRVAVDRIVLALVPVDGDRDKVAAALQDALMVALDGAETFDQNAITQDMLVSMMLIYWRDVVFQTVIADSGRAFQRSADDIEVAKMERDLLALVQQVVDDSLRPLLAASGGLSEAGAVEMQQQAIREVWSVWEQRR